MVRTDQAQRSTRCSRRAPGECSSLIQCRFDVIDILVIAGCHARDWYVAASRAPRVGRFCVACARDDSVTPRCSLRNSWLPRMGFISSMDIFAMPERSIISALLRSNLLRGHRICTMWSGFHLFLNPVYLATRVSKTPLFDLFSLISLSTL